jgi:CheY-like chemotaxis protein
MPLPDFVLIDVNMPKMNGLELLESIRSTDVWQHLKCFIVTTSDEKVDRKKAESLRISGYIIKPLKLSSPASMDSFNLMIDLLNH